MSLLDTLSRKLARPSATPGALPPGMVPAERIAAQARRDATATSASTTTTVADPELLARRERLTEQFTVGQTELGGIFYEMAIRDHVRLDVLTRKAAALQRIDAELAAVERDLAADAR